jgi:pimeloyl-ACP methyl ester carboxylesterase
MRIAEGLRFLSLQHVKKRYTILILLLTLWIVAEYSLMMRTSDSEAVAKFKSRGITLVTRSLHIRGHVLHYVSVGPDTMRTIVFVHGSPGSWDAFGRYLLDSALRTRFRMISIDRPGFGYSGYGEAMHLQQGCDVISSFLDSIKNGKPLYLAGHSLGGSIVPILAADNPGTVTGIVILAGALDPATEPKEAWRGLFAKAPMRYLLPGAMLPSNDELRYFKTDVLRLKEKLASISCRVYIIHAANDGIVDVGNVSYMKRAFTHAQVTDTIFPDGGHFIPWNHSAYIMKVLREL